MSSALGGSPVAPRQIVDAALVGRVKRVAANLVMETVGGGWALGWCPASAPAALGALLGPP
jgi:hypothetical protein